VKPTKVHTPGAWALPFLAFAIASTVALLGPLAFGDIDYNRTRFTAWATLLLGTPALVLFLARVGYSSLDARWLDWWTAGLAMYLIHLWYGFGVMLAASFTATYDLQGALVATSNFALAGLWLASAIAGWLGRPAIPLHAAATLLFTVSAIISAIVFGRPPSRRR
jgi:hypothetical protein